MPRAQVVFRRNRSVGDERRVVQSRSDDVRFRRIRLSRRSFAALIALAVLIAAAVHPARGLGVPLCMLKLQLGIDCPGCGLTRSLSCAVRGMWQDAWHYNAFGLPLFGMLISVVLCGLLPGTIARQLAVVRARHARIVRFGIGVVAAAFLTHGAVRAAVHAMTDEGGAITGLLTHSIFH